MCRILAMAALLRLTVAMGGIILGTLRGEQLPVLCDRGGHPHPQIFKRNRARWGDTPTPPAGERPCTPGERQSSGAHLPAPSAGECLCTPGRNRMRARWGDTPPTLAGRGAPLHPRGVDRPPGEICMRTLVQGGWVVGFD